MTPIDFFFFYGSTYTYLTVSRIEQAARNAGVDLRWRPFDVRAIMVEQDNIPFATKPVKMAYMWRDLERRAARHGVDWASVPPYPLKNALLANRVGIVALEEGWCPAYTKVAYRTWFLDGVPLGEPGTLEPILTKVGQDPARVIDAAQSDRVAKILDAETDAARSLGIFGSPSFAIGDEIFWGDDRLEEALAWAGSAAGSPTA